MPDPAEQDLSDSLAELTSGQLLLFRFGRGRDPLLVFQSFKMTSQKLIEAVSERCWAHEGETGGPPTGAFRR